MKIELIVKQIFPFSGNVEFGFLVNEEDNGGYISAYAQHPKDAVLNLLYGGELWKCFDENADEFCLPLRELAYILIEREKEKQRESRST
jgi:hypothetical protein